MIYKLVFLLLKIIESSIAKVDNVFIVDYFKYKSISNVAGFSCYDEKDNGDLIKNFSSANIFSTVDNVHENGTIKTYLLTHYRPLGVFLDLRCNSDEDNKNLLIKASSLKLYGELHSWLILGSTLNESIEMLNDTEYSLSTDLVVVVAEDDEFAIYDVFNLCKYRGGRLNVTLLGYWSSDDGFDIIVTQGKFSRRANYRGMILRMAGLLFDKPDDELPLPYLHDYNTKQNDTMPKFIFAIWEHIAELFNFRIEYKQLESKRVVNRNGPIIKMLVERDAELSGNTAILTPERVAPTSPSPIWPLRTCFMFRTTQSKKIKVNHFIRPLAKATWYLTIVFTFVVIFVFSTVLVVEHRSKFERYSDSILFAIGSLSQQGSDLQVTKAPTRIALLQTMIFSLLLYNYYSASVVSARLSEPLEKINDSLNELAKLNLKFGAEPILYFNFYIKRSDWEGQQFYYRRWVKVPDAEKFLPAAEGVRRILQGGFAYHIDVNVAFPKIEKLFENEHICQLTFVHLVPPTDSSILTARNGSFVEMVKVGMARVRETGLRSRLIHKWAARTPRCRTDILIIDPLTIYEVAPAFLLLVFGVIVGLLLCFFERIVYCKKYHDHGFKTKLNSIMYSKFNVWQNYNNNKRTY